jgi:hypothetical protein
MAPTSTDQNSDECVSNVRFVPSGDGLAARFEAAIHETNPRKVNPAPLGPGEHLRLLSLGVEATQDHGIMTIPVRLPRYLMPEWSQDDWSKFIGSQIGFFHQLVDEAVVQCLSLALAANDERRTEILRKADGVVVDFRGDLPNAYLPMMSGGYKVGVYRSGNGWPIWLSIQPTYDLALKEAESIRASANLPKGKSVTAAGRLASFLKADMDLPILSNSSSGIRGWIVAGVVAIIGLAAWLIK